MPATERKVNTSKGFGDCLRCRALTSPVVRVWHIYDSQGQILAVALRSKFLHPFQLFPRRWAAVPASFPKALHPIRRTCALANGLLTVDSPRTVDCRGSCVWGCTGVPRYLWGCAGVPRAGNELPVRKCVGRRSC